MTEKEKPGIALPEPKTETFEKFLGVINVARKPRSPQFGPFVRGPAVAIVIRSTANLTAVDRIANHVCSVVAARDVLLELRRAMHDIAEPIAIGGSQTGDATPDAAHRFVDDLPVMLPKGQRRIWIGRY